MTILMDNSADNPARERVQRLFNQNSELENRRRKAAQARVPSDPNAWQKMRENFQAILLEDHAFSEQHEIEYALWQLHYRRIEELRATFNAAVASAGSNSSQNGKGQARGGSDRVTKIRTQFKAFLTEATGFYHDLMLKIRAKYGLPLGYLSGDFEGLIPLSEDGNRSIELKKGLLSCHRCFIYLGDLARYKGLYGDGDSKALDFASASSYYIQATSLWLSSGNPHHQLAILASYSGDELVTIYRYFRSLAVESPFVTAKDNLIIAFEKNRQSYSQLLGSSKPSSTKIVPVRTGRGRGKGDTRLQTNDAQSEGTSAKDRSSKISEVLKSFNIRFVRLNGILFTRTSLETFAEVFSAVRSDFVDLLSSGSDEEYNFGTDASDCRLAVVRLIAILIFSIHHVNKETENQSYAEILQRSVLLENAFSATFELVGLISERCCSLTNPSASYLLSGIMVFIEWLACNQDIAVGSGLEEKQVSARLFFWNHFISFLNDTISRGVFLGGGDEDETFVNMARYEEGETANHLALPEDFELRGFVPLLPAQLILDFSGKISYGSDRDKEGKARMGRILAAGKALANVVRFRDEQLYFDSQLKKFVIGVEPQVSDTYVLPTLENLKLGGVEKENPILGQLNVEVVQPKPQLYVDTEEEDEEIVFKPFMAEKQVEGLTSKQYSAEVLVDEVNDAKVNLGKVAGSFSPGFKAYLGQNAFNTSVRPPVSVVNINPQYMQPFPPSTSMWLSKQGALENGMNDMNLFRNGPTMKLESQNYAGDLQSLAIPATFPLPTNNGTYSLPMPQKLMHSMYDSSIDGNLSMMPSSVTASGSKKNPVSRPVRHMGPPPGFGSISSKTVDESVSSMSSKVENTVISPMDDYRWLDGYSLPAINRNAGFNTYVNNSGHAYPTVGNNTSSIGTVNFPFPGKQVMTSQPVIENLNGWPDHQLSEQFKVYQEQQDQFYKGNQQFAGRKHQYQGQSLNEGFL